MKKAMLAALGSMVMSGMALGEESHWLKVNGKATTSETAEKKALQASENSDAVTRAHSAAEDKSSATKTAKFSKGVSHDGQGGTADESAGISDAPGRQTMTYASMGAPTLPSTAGKGAGGKGFAKFTGRGSDSHDGTAAGADESAGGFRGGLPMTSASIGKPSVGPTALGFSDRKTLHAGAKASDSSSADESAGSRSGRMGDVGGARNRSSDGGSRGGAEGFGASSRSVGAAAGHGGALGLCRRGQGC